MQEAREALERAHLLSRPQERNRELQRAASMILGDEQAESMREAIEQAWAQIWAREPSSYEVQRQAVREDESLDPDLRRLTLAVLETHRGPRRDLRKSPERPEFEARRLVGRLFDRWGVRSRVRKEIEQLQPVTEELRSAALRLVDRHFEHRPRILNSDSWECVSSVNESADDYEAARVMAARACELEPDNGNYLNTLGVAQYRVGLYDEALATLTRSDEINGGIPADVAFVAMSLYKLGRTEEASTALKRLRVLMREPATTGNEEAQGFLREAEELISEFVGSTDEGH
jgi:tetratricopeptide (TPR) repeat protein